MIKEIDLKDFEPTLENVGLLCELVQIHHNKMDAIINQSYELSASFRDADKYLLEKIMKETGYSIKNMV